MALAPVGDNDYETPARIKKSYALANFLREHEFPADDVQFLTDEQWGVIARLARCHPPHSEDTKKLVARILENPTDTGDIFRRFATP